jgi:hypothetical protein
MNLSIGVFNMATAKTNVIELCGLKVVLLLLILVDCPCLLAHESQKYRTVVFNGSVASGERFERKFGSMVFQLTPESTGFRISVIDPTKGSTDAHGDLSWLTTPLHGLTDRDIEASDFRNEDNSGPNKGTVNRPQMTRRIYFSKNAAAILDRFEQARGTDKEFEVFSERQQDGIGELRITKLKLGALGKGKKPQIENLNFRVKLKYLP